MDRRELDLEPHVLPDDVLRIVPSLGMFRRSSSLIADPTSEGVNLRGLGPSGTSRALVLLDGFPLEDPFGGWVYWRAISMLSIDHVASEPSGASAQFGNFGLGGVVALSSRPIERSVEVELQAGSFDTAQLAARAADRLGPVGVELTGDLFRSDGYDPIAMPGAVDHPAASNHESGGVRLDYREELRAFARWFRESLDAGTDDTTADVRTQTYGASWHHAGFEVAVYGGTQLFQQERARVSADRSTAMPVSAQRTPSNDEGVVASWHHDGLQLGIDGLRVEGAAHDTPTTGMPHVSGGEQRFVGAFVQDSERLGPLDLMGAMRVDAWDNLPREGASRTTTQLDPRLGAIIHVDEQFAIRGSVYRAFRAPTLNELYRSFQVGTILTDANPDLRAETLWGGELGAQVVSGPLEARATGFWNELSNPIFNATLDTPLADGATRQKANLEHARDLGIELDAGLRPAPAWFAQIAYVFVDAHVTSDPLLAGKRLAQDPRQRLNASLSYEGPITLTAELRYTSGQFEDDLNTLPMGAYTTVDVLARRTIGAGISAFATAVNLFGQRYLVGRSGVDTVGQPRTFMLGLVLAR